MTATGIAPTAAAAKTTLTITANLADSTYTWKLTCEPLGGKHHNRKAACALIAKAGIALFAPVPKDVMCTQIYGGPERVKVTGSVRGKKVNTLFVRSDGCQIARYDRAAALFTIPGTTLLRGLVTLDDQPADGTVIFVSDRRQISVKTSAGEFVVRLPAGTWLGSASAGARSCTPIVVSIPSELPEPAGSEPWIIACRSSSTG